MPKPKIQFSRAERFGIVPRSGEKKCRCISGIVGEVARLPSCISHLPAPSSPILLFGKNPIEVGAAAIKLAETAVDGAGRKLRRDAGVLVAGVISWPGDPALLKGPCRDSELDAYAGWEADVVEYLKQKYGNSLQYIVRHEDGTHTRRAADFPHAREAAGVYSEVWG